MEFFEDIMILLESFFDSGEKEVQSVKSGAIFLDLWLDMFFGLKWAKEFFRLQTPKSWIFLRFHKFIGFVL